MIGRVRAQRTLAGTAFPARILNRPSRTRPQKFLTSTLAMMGPWLVSELRSEHIPPSFAVYDSAVATSTCSFQLLVVTVWTKWTKAFTMNTWYVVLSCEPSSVAAPLPAHCYQLSCSPHAQRAICTCGITAVLVADGMQALKRQAKANRVNGVHAASTDSWRGKIDAGEL
jgi:hypothetical protein